MPPPSAAAWVDYSLASTQKSLQRQPGLSGQDFDFFGYLLTVHSSQHQVRKSHRHCIGTQDRETDRRHQRISVGRFCCCRAPPPPLAAPASAPAIRMYTHLPSSPTGRIRRSLNSTKCTVPLMYVACPLFVSSVVEATTAAAGLSVDEWGVKCVCIRVVDGTSHRQNFDCDNTRQTCAGGGGRTSS